MQYKEWLLTNRFGAYSFGTTTGCIHKPEHALFSAVLRPPLRRKICVRRLHDEIYMNQKWQSLTPVLDPASGNPKTIAGLEIDFRMENYLPVYVFSTPGFVIRKRIWIQPTLDALFVQYTVENALEPCRIRVQPLLLLDEAFFSRPSSKPLLNITPGGFNFNIERDEDKWLHISTDRQKTAVLTVNNFAQTHFSDSAAHKPETNYIPAALSFILRQDEIATIRFGLKEDKGFNASDVYRETLEYSGKPFFVSFPANDHEAETFSVVCNAKAFQIERPTEVALENHSLVADYPRGIDNGRATLLAIPGLLTATGDHETMKNILEMLKRHVQKNLLPNRFFEDITPPTYDSADNALWFFNVVYTYWRATRDRAFIEGNYPFLIKLLENHISGTKHGVKMDSEDGLLTIASGASAQTWMDQKIGEWPLTPRSGKPIEIQALWYNALRIAHEISKLLGRKTGAEKTKAFLERTHHSLLKKFWINELKYLADVVSEHGRDMTFRANQIIALGLSFSPFSQEQIQSVVEKAQKLLVTPYGLRTLTPHHPSYRGGVPSSGEEKSGAWHNGVVHPWLTWSFVQASMRCGVPATELYNTFSPLFSSVNDGILGHVCEAYTGDAPHEPLGAPASAVSLGAVIQCIQLLKSQM